MHTLRIANAPLSLSAAIEDAERAASERKRGKERGAQSAPNARAHARRPERAPARKARPSAETPDWLREACSRFSWKPSQQLLRSVRDYQAIRARPGALGTAFKKWAVLRHRFWSAVTGADIPINSAHIAGGLLLPHPTGVVLHPDAVIGPNCALFQQVTVGTGPRPGLPQIGGHVDIGPGAKILGGVKIGDHAVIGANAVVVDDVPAGAVAVGIPAVVKKVLPFQRGA